MGGCLLLGVLLRLGLLVVATGPVKEESYDFITAFTLGLGDFIQPVPQALLQAHVRRNYLIEWVFRRELRQLAGSRMWIHHVEPPFVACTFFHIKLHITVSNIGYQFQDTTLNTQNEAII